MKIKKNELLFVVFYSNKKTTNQKNLFCLVKQKDKYNWYNLLKMILKN